LRMEAKISLVYRDKRKAKAILEALSPDNVDTPEGLLISTLAQNNEVITVIKYNGDNLFTLQSTIDDLLSCVSIAEKSISALKGQNLS